MSDRDTSMQAPEGPEAPWPVESGGIRSAPGMSAAPSVRGGAELEGPAEGSAAIAGAAAAGSTQSVHTYAGQQQHSAALKTP